MMNGENKEGFQGACWCCESVAEKNLELLSVLINVRLWFNAMVENQFSPLLVEKKDLPVGTADMQQYLDEVIEGN